MLMLSWNSVSLLFLFSLGFNSFFSVVLCCLVWQLAMHNLNHVLTEVEENPDNINTHAEKDGKQKQQVNLILADEVDHENENEDANENENEVKLHGGVNFIVGDIDSAESMVRHSTQHTYTHIHTHYESQCCPSVECFDAGLCCVVLYYIVLYCECVLLSGNFVH